jgi:hypothetical protein
MASMSSASEVPIAGAIVPLPAEMERGEASGSSPRRGVRVMDDVRLSGVGNPNAGMMPAGKPAPEAC